MADASAETKEEKNGTITPRTTVEELRSIITESSNGLLLLPSDAYNEVFDGIFIGERWANRKWSFEFYLHPPIVIYLLTREECLTSRQFWIMSKIMLYAEY